MLRRQSGFTLIELLLVAVILGILAAIVVPQFSTNTDDTKKQAQASNLAGLRAAIDLYAQQHEGKFPGQLTAGTGFGDANTADAFKNQLTKFTDTAGAAAEAKSETKAYGPYLRTFPKEPVKNLDSVTISTTGTLATVPSCSTGWFYIPAIGRIEACS